MGNYCQTSYLGKHLIHATLRNCADNENDDDSTLTSIADRCYNCINNFCLPNRNLFWHFFLQRIFDIDEDTDLISQSEEIFVVDEYLNLITLRTLRDTKWIIKSKLYGHILIVKTDHRPSKFQISLILVFQRFNDDYYDFVTLQFIKIFRNKK